MTLESQKKLGPEVMELKDHKHLVETLDAVGVSQMPFLRRILRPNGASHPRQ